MALLEKAFPGVRKDGLNQLAGAISLQVTTEEEATTAVGKLTTDSVNSFITDWRKDADAEINKANQTREANLREKFDFVEKKPDNGGNPTPPANGNLDAAAIQKLITDAVTAANTVLQTELASFKSTAVNANRRELLVKELADVPEAYKGKVLKDFDRMSFKDEDSFNAYLNETKTDVATFSQELANKGLGQQGKPIFGNPNPDGVSKGVENYITEKAKEAKGDGLGGKEV
ncbi:MAG: hypothetical protein LBJ17_02170 [Dysgonamonadaceae bacterium]|nr:hypothetical protein [Dysgonamonadaceae bacterium]